MNDKQVYLILFASWIVATISTLGSLFFSEVMGFIPCTLCWYERICMYPLVVILFTGLIKFDRSVFRYVLPLTAFGWVISLYHNLVQLEVIPESASPCVRGIPCSMKYINWFGFITIPLLAFIAFTLLLIFIYLFYRRSSDAK